MLLTGVGFICALWLPASDDFLEEGRRAPSDPWGDATAVGEAVADNGDGTAPLSFFIANIAATNTRRKESKDTGKYNCCPLCVYWNLTEWHSSVRNE